MERVVDQQLVGCVKRATDGPCTSRTRPFCFVPRPAACYSPGRLAETPLRVQNADHVGRIAQRGSNRSDGPTLSAAGDRADGRGCRHSVRSLLAAAALGVVGNRRRRLGGLDRAFLGRRLRWGELPRLLLSNLAMLLAVAATAAAWHHCRWYLFASDDLGCYARRKAQPVCVEAIAVRMPRLLPTPPFDPMRMMPPTEGSRLEVDLTAIRDGSQWRRASGRATLLVQGPPPQVRAGDRLRLFAHLSEPLGPQNPGAFDYAAYLRAEGVRSRLQAEVPQCVSVVQHRQLVESCGNSRSGAGPQQSAARRLSRSSLCRNGRSRFAG